MLKLFVLNLSYKKLHFVTLSINFNLLYGWYRNLILTHCCGLSLIPRCFTSEMAIQVTETVNLSMSRLFPVHVHVSY